MKSVDLYVIERVGVGGGPCYWACSASHGTGWIPGGPKQAFSPSEVARELRRLMRHGWMGPAVVVRQLSMAWDGPAPVAKSSDRVLTDEELYRQYGETMAEDAGFPWKVPGRPLGGPEHWVG